MFSTRASETQFGKNPSDFCAHICSFPKLGFDAPQRC